MPQVNDDPSLNDYNADQWVDKFVQDCPAAHGIRVVVATHRSRRTPPTPPTADAAHR